MLRSVLFVCFSPLTLICTHVFFCFECATLSFFFFFGSIIYVTIHLKQATVESIMRDKMPKKGGRWWFSWRGRNATIKEVSGDRDVGLHAVRSGLV